MGTLAQKFDFYLIVLSDIYKEKYFKLTFLKLGILTANSHLIATNIFYKVILSSIFANISL
jgi:hypothetical protein